jgi:basic membrane protein A
MKKYLAILLAALMVFGAVALVGCAPKDEPEVSKPDESKAPEASGDYKKDPKDMKVVALLSGVITDNGWNQICYESVKNIADKYGIEAEYNENIAVSDMAEYIRTYAEEKYDMIIVHGSQFKASAEDLAREYPDSHFCLSYGFRVDESTADQVQEIPNLAYVGPSTWGC